MASTYLTRTPTTQTIDKYTMSFWVKRSKLGSSAQRIYSHHQPSTYMWVRFESNNQFRFVQVVGGNEMTLKTNRLFRDTNAWYHIVITFDTTQSTQSDRIKMWINGVQETSFASETYPSQNVTVEAFNSGTPFEIGRYHSANNEYFDGLLSHCHMTVGYAYSASTFGSTDATTGEWKINTSPSVTYGTNGFFILKDGNSVTDQSGNGNNFTVGGGTLTNTEDNPSNVFCTLNPLIQNAGGVISQGANTAYQASSTHNSVVGTLGAITGKYYFEVDADTIGSAVNATAVGITSTDSAVFQNTAHDAGTDSTDHIYTAGAEYQNNNTAVSYGNTYSAGDIIGVAMDLDNGKLYFSKNGTWQNSGDPTSGATGTGAKDITTGKYYVPMLGIYGGTLFKANFGNGTFGANSVASAGTNASGNGIFEYDVPTGYTALSTKGLNL